jgi:hypothetical protein
MLKLMKKDKLILLKKEKIEGLLTVCTNSKPSIFFKEKIKIRDGLSMITTHQRARVPF